MAFRESILSFAEMPTALLSAVVPGQLQDRVQGKKAAVSSNTMAQLLARNAGGQIVSRCGGTTRCS